MKKEIRVYTLRFAKIENFDESLMPQNESFDEERFMDLSEKQGSVYSLKGFENALNNDEFDTYWNYVYFKERTTND